MCECEFRKSADVAGVTVADGIVGSGARDETKRSSYRLCDVLDRETDEGGEVNGGKDHPQLDSFGAGDVQLPEPNLFHFAMSSEWRDGVAREMNDGDGREDGGSNAVLTLKHGLEMVQGEDIVSDGTFLVAGQDDDTRSDGQGQVGWTPQPDPGDEEVGNPAQAAEVVREDANDIGEQ